MSQLKKGARVAYRARVTRGNGKIVAVHDTTRGKWYEVKDDNGRVLQLRAAQLNPI